MSHRGCGSQRYLATAQLTDDLAHIAECAPTVVLETDEQRLHSSRIGDLPLFGRRAQLAQPLLEQ